MGTISQRVATDAILLQGLMINCPRLLTNRSKVIVDIKAHGGTIEHKINHAHILLTEDNEGIDSYRRVVTGNKDPDAHVVDRSWLYDSISEGVKQDPRLYLPSYLAEPPTASSSRPESKTAVKTNERRNRNTYTMFDTEQIVAVLVVMPDWSNLSVIAKCLSRLSRRHSESSYISHLQSDMDRGNQYISLAIKSKENLGVRYQEDMKAQLCERHADIRELLEYRAPQSPGVKVSKRQEFIPPKRSNRQDIVRETGEVSIISEDTANVQESTAKGCNSLQQAEMPEDRNPVNLAWRDVCVATEAAKRVEMAVATSAPLELQLNYIKESPKEHRLRDMQVSAELPLTPKFTRSDRRKLVEHLASWLQTKYEENTSSQDSVIGWIKMSQETPQPPLELFRKIALEVPAHSAEDWQTHYEKGVNKVVYLRLAKELLERNIAGEKVKVLDYKGQAVQQIREGFDQREGTSEEVEAQTATQEEADEELEINSEAHLDADAEPKKLFFSEDEEEELDELESSFEEDLIDTSDGQMQSKVEEAMVNSSPVKTTEYVVIADSLDSVELQSDEEIESRGNDEPVDQQIELEDQHVDHLGSQHEQLADQLVDVIDQQDVSSVDERAVAEDPPASIKRKWRQIMIPYVEIPSTNRSSSFRSISVKQKNGNQSVEPRKRRRLVSIESDSDYHEISSSKSRPIIARSQSRGLRSQIFLSYQRAISSSSSSRYASSSIFTKSEVIDAEVAALIARQHLPRKIVRKTREQRLQALADKYSVPKETAEKIFKLRGEYDAVEEVLLTLTTS